MSDQSPARASHPVDVNGVLRLLALIAVIIGVLVLAAAAFVLSYAGIHAIALSAGVSATLARLYPLIFDAMLVVASAAILSLRGAGLVMRCYAWLSMLVLLCAAAGADALHATATRLPHRTAAATVAIIPWALVLLGFGLLLAMLRHARQRRAQDAEARAQAAAAAPALTTGQQSSRVQAEPGTRADQTAGGVAAAGGRDLATVAGIDVLMSREPAAPAAVPEPATSSWPSVPSTPDVPSLAVPDRAAGRHADSQAAELALDADPGNDDPTSDEAHSASHAAHWVPRARGEERAVTDGSCTGDYPAPVMSPAPVAEIIPAWDAAQEQLADTAQEQYRHAAPIQPQHAVPEPATDGEPLRPAHGAGTELDGGPDREPGRDPAAEGEAGAKRQPGPGHEPGAVRELTTEGDAGADRGPEADRQPEAARGAGADDEPGPDRGPETERQPEAARGAGADDEPGPDRGPETERQPAAERELATAGGALAQGEPVTEREPDAAPEPEAPVASFDRMWSSPVPPDA